MCQLWKLGNSTNPSRQEYKLRKSERIHNLEIQVARLEVIIDMLATMLVGMTEKQGQSDEMNMESGKWYKNTQE